MAHPQCSSGGFAANAKKAPDTRRVLSRKDAREVYDKHGVKDQVRDSESVYGGPATEALLAATDFSNARRVFEFGHGSGRLAARLLRQYLPADCSYVGVDQSEVMHGLASQRLAPFSDRVELLLVSDGEPSTCAPHIPDGSVDVFVSTYVLDLLSDEDTAKVLDLAARLLKPEGQLALTGLTFGSRVGLLLSVATWVWELVHWVAPRTVGGCRAQNLTEYLGPCWELRSINLVSGGLITSEVLVCRKKIPGD